jgi:hypothetical protein
MGFRRAEIEVEKKRGAKIGGGEREKATERGG